MVVRWQRSRPKSTASKSLLLFVTCHSTSTRIASCVRSQLMFARCCHSTSRSRECSAYSSSHIHHASYLSRFCYRSGLQHVSRAVSRIFLQTLVCAVMDSLGYSNVHDRTSLPTFLALSRLRSDAALLSFPSLSLSMMLCLFLGAGFSTSSIAIVHSMVDMQPRRQQPLSDNET